MKMSKMMKITLVSLLTIGLVSYVVYAMIFLSGPDDDEKCMSMELIVKQD